MMRACSITKMITATAILQLQEKGLLSVNDTIDTYFDSFPHAQEITIHHLLSHTSGISSTHFSFEWCVLPTQLSTMINGFTNLPLEFTPGSDYRYSNANYYLLTAIIEKVSGESYEAFIEENICKPADMQNSLFISHDYMIIKNAASPYMRDAANRCVNGHYIYDGNNKGGGSLICTAYDLYLFMKALDEGTLLKTHSLHSMRKAYSDKENYGYGCNITTHHGENAIEHGGMLSSGFHTIALSLVDHEIYIVLMGNMFWRKEIIDDLVAIVLEKPYEVPTDTATPLTDEQHDEYTGVYNHPEFENEYTIAKKDNYLLLPDGKMLLCVGKDQFLENGHPADNIVYKFARNEHNDITQLRIQGCGGPYFEIRCDRKGSI